MTLTLKSMSTGDFCLTHPDSPLGRHVIRITGIPAGTPASTVIQRANSTVFLANQREYQYAELGLGVIIKDPPMQQDNSVVAAICREWERITGGGRYRLRVGGGGVEIAQFHSPRECAAVVYSRGEAARTDSLDLARFARLRKSPVNTVVSDIQRFCETISGQFRDLVISDTSEY